MLWRLRVLLFYILSSITCIVLFIIYYILIKIFHIKYDFKYKIACIFSQIFIWLVKICCGLKYKTYGLDNLPNEPCIVLSNHQSFWDNIVMQIIIPKHSWVIKKELLNIPFFGWGLKMLDPISIDRTNHTSINQILKDGIKKLQEGLWLVIFPEATRLHPNQITKFKPSAIKLAMIAKVSIVLVVHNAGIYWPKGFWIKRNGTITIKVIDVIDKDTIQKSDVRYMNSYIQQIINQEKNKLNYENNTQK